MKKEYSAEQTNILATISAALLKHQEKIFQTTDINALEATLSVIFVVHEKGADNFAFFDIVNYRSDVFDDLETYKPVLRHIYEHYIKIKFEPSINDKVYSKPPEAYKYKAYTPDIKLSAEQEAHLNYLLYHE